MDLSHKVLVRNKPGGSGLYAAAAISKAETILFLNGRLASEASRYSIQVNEKNHLEPFSADPSDCSSLWRFLNHSCCPNALVDTVKMKVIALVDIKEGEEITCDYDTTEYKIAFPFCCRCENENCRGNIGGYYKNAGNS